MYDTLYNDENTPQVDQEQIQVFEVRQSHFTEEDLKELKEQVEMMSQLLTAMNAKLDKFL